MSAAIIPQDHKRLILQIAYGVLCGMEREGATYIMTVNGPVTPAVAQQMLLARYPDLMADAEVVAQ